MVICTYAHCVMYAYKVPCSGLRGVTLTTTKNRTDGPVKKIIPLASSLREVSLMFLKDFKNRMRMMIKKKKEKEEEEIPFFSVELDLSLPFLFPFPCVDFVCSSLVSALSFWVFVSFFSFLLSLRSLFSHPFSVLLFFVSFSSLVSSSGCFSSSVSVLSDIFGSFFFSVTHRMHL